MTEFGTRVHALICLLLLDYLCSSPDADDVQRVARHTCSRKQIHLRNKAAPPPNALEYADAEFVEMV